MAMRKVLGPLFLLVLICVVGRSAAAQSFRVQCPTSTLTHPVAANNNSEPAYAGPTTYTTGPKGYFGAKRERERRIKCQQISGGDGYATMGDGTQTYMFSFGPLSGLSDISLRSARHTIPERLQYCIPGRTPLQPGRSRHDEGLFHRVFTYNGAVGLAPDPNDGRALNGHVDPRPIMDVGVMNGNIPAPLMAIDEDDEFFLTLTNVGQIMRPDLFEQHTVHFHGYPNASAFYDGVPDASVAINIGGSFTYYYLAPDAGTYFWHCHITPPEHLQMGMVGQLYVRPRQNRVAVGGGLYASLQHSSWIRARNATPPISCAAIPCRRPIRATRAATGKYAYNDGDGSTYYDIEYPLQIHGFDPNFHFVGMTFNPENFTDMKDKYFLLNGRSYPDTITPGPLETTTADDVKHFGQPMNAIIQIPAGKRALLRISDLDINEYQTLASLGIPMNVIAHNAKLLRDQAGNNLYYNTNSITLGGGESIDVILDASDTTKYPAGSVFYLFTPNLDHLSNDAENFGGLMTEVRIN